MPVYVLDGSAAMKWCFADESEAAFDELQFELSGPSAAFVPQHWSLEVANVAMIGERRKRVTEAGIKLFSEILKTLQIHEDLRPLGSAFAETLDLARKHQLSVYDAAYLELAMRLGATLASADKPLRRAAAACGVECFPEHL